MIRLKLCLALFVFTIKSSIYLVWVGERYYKCHVFFFNNILFWEYVCVFYEISEKYKENKNFSWILPEMASFNIWIYIILIFYTLKNPDWILLNIIFCNILFSLRVSNIFQYPYLFFKRMIFDGYMLFCNISTGSCS